MSRHNSYCFTINNYTEKDIEQVKKITNNCRYLVCGKEIGEKCGTPHLQGYLTYKTSISKRALSKQLKRAHLEVARGTPDQNFNYCRKEQIWLEHGERPKQGRRTDLEELRDMIKNNEKDHEIINKISSFQALRSIDLLRKKMIPPQTKKPHVYWIWGDTGIGKSRIINEVYTEWDSVSYENSFMIGYTWIVTGKHFFS